MWEVFRVKFCELASRFDLVLTRHILKWSKSVLLWSPSVSLQRREVTQSSLASQPFRDCRRIGGHFVCISTMFSELANWWQPLWKTWPKRLPPTWSQISSFRVILAKGEKALVSEIDTSVKNKWKFWRWLKEKVETGLCLARFASRRCVWVTASKRSVCRVRLSVPGVTRRSGTDQ